MDQEDEIIPTTPRDRIKIGICIAVGCFVFAVTGSKAVRVYNDLSRSFAVKLTRLDSHDQKFPVALGSGNRARYDAQNLPSHFVP